MAVVELRHTAALLRALGGGDDGGGGGGGGDGARGVAARCERLAKEVDAGIAAHGVVERPELGGKVYAYEVDGCTAARPDAFAPAAAECALCPAAALAMPT